MSILDEIKNRAVQPKVSPRQDSLTLETQPTPPETQTQDSPTSQPTSQLQQLEAELASFPEISQRVPVRLEVQIKHDIDTLCSTEKITIETLLEAFHITCKDRESLMRQVVKEAKKRIQTRKAAGNLRSNITRLNNAIKVQK